MAKTIKVRVQNKTETPTNWEKATNFSPLKGELVVYMDSTGTHLKVGDGSTNVNDLPFITSEWIEL